MNAGGTCALLSPGVTSVALLFAQDLMERLDSLLCGDSSESLKSLCLKLLLCLVTVRLNLRAPAGASVALCSFCQVVLVHLTLSGPGNQSRCFSSA